MESYVEYARGFADRDSVAGYDWAILKLFEPLGEWFGYLGYNGYHSDWNGSAVWTTVGYPHSLGAPPVEIPSDRPSCQFFVAVTDDEDDDHDGLELETYSDMSGGNSGGPIWAWWDIDGQLQCRVVGVYSGFVDAWYNDFNVHAGGKGFVNLIKWGRSNW